MKNLRETETAISDSMTWTDAVLLCDNSSENDLRIFMQELY